MRPRFAIRALLLLALLLVAATPALAATADLAAAVTWIKGKQAADGGFSDGFSDKSSISATTDAILAAASQGGDISTWGSTSPLDYLAAQLPATTDAGPLAKIILAAVATGQAPTTFAGVDLVAKLNQQYDTATGTFKGLVNDHAFAMLALKAAGQPIPEKAATALESLQTKEGGWSFDGAGQADTNTTAVAIQALVAAGRSAESAAVKQALTFLKTQQNDDGGFPYQKPSQYGTATDANSTAYVILALTAARQPLTDWKNPDNALAALQLADGPFEYQTGQGANYLATVQAVPALAGRSFVALPVVKASRAPTATAASSAPATLPTTGAAARPAPAIALLAGLALVLLAGGWRRRLLA